MCNLWFDTDLYSASVNALRYEISCYIGPRYCDLTLICLLLQSTHCGKKYRVIPDRVITELDCTNFRFVFHWISSSFKILIRTIPIPTHVWTCEGHLKTWTMIKQQKCVRVASVSITSLIVSRTQFHASLNIFFQWCYQQFLSRECIPVFLE